MIASNHKQTHLNHVFEIAAAARADGDHPFGALLVVDGIVVAEARNRVHTNRDITAHAELMLVRNLERDGLLDQLALGTVYASCEPCPMCVGGMFWAGARAIVYGLSAQRLNDMATPADSTPFGFVITAGQLAEQATPVMLVDGPNLEDEAAVAHRGYWNPSAAS
jgi:tRNA(Arg) A34 adenosine deaminase TadA